MNFFARYKRIFILLGFLAVSIGIGILLWKIFFTGEIGPQSNQTNVNNPSGTLPGAGTGSGQIIDNQGGGNVPTSGENGQGGVNGTSSPGQIPGRNSEPVSSTANGGLTQAQNVSNSPTIGTMISGNSVQYYNQLDGKFYKLDAGGNLKAISEQSFPNVQSVTWAPDGQKAVMEYPDGTKSVYNFSTAQSTILPAHWENFSFSPDSSKISSKSLGDSVDNRYVIVANSDGSKAHAIETIGENAPDVQVSWSPNNLVAATYVKGVDFDSKQVNFIGFNGENMKSMTIQGRGFQSQWSTTGDKLLFSVYNSNDGLKPKLWIAETANGNLGDVQKGISLNTWASKCTFANDDEIYCAVPKTLQEGAGLFPESANQTPDDLYKVNLKTGIKSLIATPQGSHTISQVMVDPGQSKLYFTDQNSGQVYKINLK